MFERWNFHVSTSECLSPRGGSIKVDSTEFTELLEPNSEEKND